MAGSSPLARGTPNKLDPEHISNGLIPARAGNTVEHLGSFRFGWAHPRSRGEHVTFLYGNLHDAGSSPLARGTRRRRKLCHRVPGLIPARAGNTFNARPSD